MMLVNVMNGAGVSSLAYILNNGFVSVGCLMRDEPIKEMVLSIYIDLDESAKIDLRGFLIYKLEAGELFSNENGIVPKDVIMDHILIAIENNVPRGAEAMYGDAGNVFSELRHIVRRAFLYYEEAYAIGDGCVSEEYISNKFKVSLAVDLPDFLTL